jgi:hypothetical protein
MNYSLFLWDQLVSLPHMTGDMLYLFFCAWFLSLNMMSSRLIYIVANDMLSIFLLATWSVSWQIPVYFHCIWPVLTHIYLGLGLHLALTTLIKLFYLIPSNPRGIFRIRTEWWSCLCYEKKVIVLVKFNVVLILMYTLFIFYFNNNIYTYYHYVGEICSLYRNSHGIMFLQSRDHYPLLLFYWLSRFYQICLCDFNIIGSHSK